MSHDVIDRRVMLGGQTRKRGLLGGGRNKLEWVGMALTGLWLVPVLGGGTLGWVRILLALVIVGVAVGFWTPFPGPFAGRSLAGWVAWEFRFRTRRRGPEGVFVPAYQRTEATTAKTSAAYSVPEAMGSVRVDEATLTSGESIAVVRHASPARKSFYTVAFEMRGDTAGMEASWSFGQAHMDWGRFCATLAAQDSYVRTVQQIARVVPYDTADHTMWIKDRIPVGVPQALKDSYVELLDTAALVTEQHRSWLVLRLPITAAFQLAARRLDASDGLAGERALVAREAAAAMQYAASLGIALRPLDERRLGAVVRALQDADHPIDQVAGMDFTRAWLTWDARARRHVQVQGTRGPWYTRTAAVPHDGIEPGRFSPDFLLPLISGVEPSVVRTIATVIDLVPAEKARSAARRDVTLDTGASREAAGRVSDGSESEQLTSSQQRLEDLRPGTGHEGANWAMSVTFAARSEDDLDVATRSVRAAARRAHISHLKFLDGWQDAGLLTSLPFARGMAVRR